MKEKGFTLIELLSVIVILAIIALIATPIILNIIKDAKEESNKRSVEMYAKAVENAVVQYQIKKHKMPTTYEDIKDYIKIDGEKISCEEIEIYADGKIYIKGIKKDNDIVLAKSYGTKYYKNGDIVYYDVVNAEGCTEEDYHEDNSKTGYNGLEATKSTDNQNSCLKFYTFLDDGGKTINLLLDHNTTATVEWINQSDFEDADGIINDDLKNDYGSCMFSGVCIGNNVGPITLLKQLKEDTKGWKGTIKPSNYSLNQITQTSKANYTIDYSEYKARLITAQEVAQITEANKEDTLNFKEENSAGNYFFHNLSNDYTTGVGGVCASTGCKYGWLYDRTSIDCKNYGCLNNSNLLTSGYWTSSANASFSSSAWFVYFIGNFGISSVSVTSSYGIRPVIEVLKSNL